MRYLNEMAKIYIAKCLLVLLQRRLGGELEVPALHGRVKLKIPPETQTGKVFRIKGMGVPSVRGGDPGDLCVKSN